MLVAACRVSGNDNRLGMPRRRIAIRYGEELPPREAESKACRARLLRDRLVAQWFVKPLFYQRQLTIPNIKENT